MGVGKGRGVVGDGGEVDDMDSFILVLILYNVQYFLNTIP